MFGKDCLKVKDSRQAKSEYSQPEYPGFVSYTNRARESLWGVKEGQRTGELKEWPPPEVKSRVSRRPEKGQKVAGETGRRRVNEPASLAPGNSLTGAKLPWRTRLTVTPVPTGLSLPHPAILEFALNMLLDLI